MGDKKEDSGFGFKDKSKALDTLVLLEKEPSSYQSLTVRGLLGRAKRTLKLTKDTEKIKNISEAIDVFEKWIEDKKSGKTDDKKSSNTNREDKKRKADDGGAEDKDDSSADTVPGLGFKDKDKALETIKVLEGRDPDYQKLAVKGLIGRAKRVLTCTKDKDKCRNIKDAVDVFEKFLDDFDKKNMSKQNMSYLSLSVVEGCIKLAEHHDVLSLRVQAFITAYRSVDGLYKKLRTLEDSDTKKTWDIVRNDELKTIKKSIGDPDLFEDEGNPTKEHLMMIMWAYSPQEQRMKKLKIAPPGGGGDESIEVYKDDDKKQKRKHKDDSSNGESHGKKKK